MSLWKVEAEQVIIHTAIVEAETSEAACETYIDGEYVEDLGDAVDPTQDPMLVLNVSPYEPGL